MAATGKTPILLYGSTTATNAPVAGNLTNSSDGCEIAINVADKNLFFKDSTNAVNTVPIRQSSGSSDGWLSSANWTTFNSKQTAYTNLTTIGSLANSTGWLYNNGSGTFSYSTPSASDVGAVPTTRTISTTSPLAGGGDLSANRTFSITQATTSTDGYLSSTDWNTFNNKQPAGTYVTSVTGTAPVVSSGGTTPAISMAAATGSVNGYLTSTDWTTFNSKQAALVSGSNIKTVNGTTLLGSGDLGTITVAYGGTGLTSVTSGYIPFGNSATALASDSNFVWDNTNKRLGLGTASPSRTLTLVGSGAAFTSALNPTIRMNNTASGRFAIVELDSAEVLTIWNGDAGTSGGDIIFKYGSGSGTESFRLTNTGNAKINNGNLVIGTSGKGITTGSTISLGLGTNNGVDKVTIFNSGGVSVGGTTDPGQGNLHLKNADYTFAKLSGKKTTVSTSATTISYGANDWATLCLINGLDGVGNFFADLVFTCTTGGPTALSSKSVSGSPAGRTYTMSSGNLQLAMASGTYTIYCQTINSI